MEKPDNLKLAREAYKEKRIDDAQKYYELVKAEFPQNPEAIYFCQYYGLLKATEKKSKLLSDIQSSFPKTVELLKGYFDSKQMLDAATQIIDSFPSLVDDVIASARREFDKQKARRSAGAGNISDYSLASTMLQIAHSKKWSIYLAFADELYKQFPDQSTGGLVMDCWKKAVIFRHSYAPARNYKDKGWTLWFDIVMKRIKKIEPTYEPLYFKQNGAVVLGKNALAPVEGAFEFTRLPIDELCKDVDISVPEEKTGKKAKKNAEPREKGEKTPNPKKKKLILGLAIGIGGVALALGVLGFTYFIPNADYSYGQSLLETHRYQDAISAFDRCWWGKAKQQANFAKAGLAFENDEFDNGVSFVKEGGGEVVCNYDYDGGKDNGAGNNPTKEGFAFAKWHIISYSFSFESGAKKNRVDLSVKAIWNPTERLLHIADPDNISAGSFTISDYKNDQYLPVGTYITLQAKTNPGYRFDGWYKVDASGKATTKVGSSETQSISMTESGINIKPQWRDDWSCEKIDGGYELFSYHPGDLPSQSEIIIPDEFKGFPIVSIKDSYFRDRSLESVILPKHLKNIGNSTFSYCKNLKEIVIPDTVERIGDDAFESSGLEKVTIGGTNCVIESGAFRNCNSLKTVILKEGVISIGDSAFVPSQSITSITFPKTLTTIGGAAFYGCYGLTKVYIPANVTKIGARAFMYDDAIELYCEAPSKPSGWDDGWNFKEYEDSAGRFEVHWGVTPEQFAALSA